MSSISRVQLPENFYDVTSSYLLTQPEPQYLYAQMYLASIQASLDTDGEMDMPGRSAGMSVGAQYSSAERDRLMMADPIMTGVFVPSVDFKGQPGNVVRFNRPSFTDSTYTQASREITAGQSISTTTLGVESEQNALTLKRFAGPYSNTNSAVQPFGIDRFYAQFGVHKLPSMVGAHLKRDYHKFLDTATRVLLDDASSTVRPAGMTTDDTATAAGQFPFDYDTLCRAELAADNANLPVFPDGYRVLVLTPTQVNQLRTDSDYLSYAEKHPQYNALFPGYVSSVNKLHIFKSTTLSEAVNTNSIPIHKGHLIAPGALMGGMGEAPRVAPSTDDNYGEESKVIWLAYLAMGLADNRFVVSVRSTN